MSQAMKNDAGNLDLAKRRQLRVTLALLLAVLVAPQPLFAADSVKNLKALFQAANSPDSYVTFKKGLEMKDFPTGKPDGTADASFLSYYKNPLEVGPSSSVQPDRHSTIPIGRGKRGVLFALFQTIKKPIEIVISHFRGETMEATATIKSGDNPIKGMATGKHGINELANRIALRIAPGQPDVTASDVESWIRVSGERRKEIASDFVANAMEKAIADIETPRGRPATQDDLENSDEFRLALKDNSYEIGSYIPKGADGGGKAKDFTDQVVATLAAKRTAGNQKIPDGKIIQQAIARLSAEWTGTQPKAANAPSIDFISDGAKDRHRPFFRIMRDLYASLKVSNDSNVELFAHGGQLYAFVLFRMENQVIKLDDGKQEKTYTMTPVAIGRRINVLEPTKEIDQYAIFHTKNDGVEKDKAYQILADAINHKRKNPNCPREGYISDSISAAAYILMHHTPFLRGSPAATGAAFDAILRAGFGITHPGGGKLNEGFWRAVTSSWKDFLSLNGYFGDFKN